MLPRSLLEEVQGHGCQGRRIGKDWMVRGRQGAGTDVSAQELGQEKLSGVTSEDRPLD